MKAFMSALAVLIACIAAPAVSQERLLVPGENQRENMLACPPGHIMTGLDPETSNILCQSGYDGLLTAEILDESPATQWPSERGPARQDFPFIESFFRGSHDYYGPTMHACPRDSVLTGIHLARNAFLCSGLIGTFGAHALGRFEATPGEERRGVLACPRGFALAGVHAGNRTLLCAEVRLCRQNDQCRTGTDCKIDNAAERISGSYCQPSGSIGLYREDNCTGDFVTSLSPAPNRHIPDLRSNGDKARSARFLGVRGGTIFEYFDDDGYNTGDDRAIVLARRDLADVCLGDLDLKPTGRVSDADFEAIKPTSGSLSGHVTSVRFFTAIQHSDGRCLVRAGPSRDSSMRERLRLTTCLIPRMPLWYYNFDGTIRIQGDEGPRCLGARIYGTRNSAGDVFEPGAASLMPCDGLTDEMRWTHTAAGQLKIYSTYCLTMEPDPTLSIPVLERCREPVPLSQRWFANL